MRNTPSTFALFFGNRGFFPGSLIAQAREELTARLEALGHKTLLLDAGATRHGAVETVPEGQRYADFLREHRGTYDGVILSLPNFGDENGAVAALKEAGVPIFIHAYPDELSKMAPASRRDAFCGKFSIMDVFTQYGIPFTVMTPHVAHPAGEAFARNIDTFDRTCRVVRGMRGLVVGGIGARTTPFKTVRIDEVTLQRHGITVETLDMAEVIARVQALADNADPVTECLHYYAGYTRWDGVPEAARVNLAKLDVVLRQIVEEYGMDALAIRCWLELQQQLGISPCVVMSALNDRGIVTACEMDIGNAVMMSALSLASGTCATCLDWNNNFGTDENKCILFHCGPVPQGLMRGPGQVTDHTILMNAVGEGCAYGCNTGRIKPMAATYGGALTEAGELRMYLGEGSFTEDPIPDDFFGCAGVFEVPNLQQVLLRIGKAGHRHHVSVSPGRLAASVDEACGHYLGYQVMMV